MLQMQDLINVLAVPVLLQMTQAVALSSNQGKHPTGEVCYGKIGCFPMEHPWYDAIVRPIPPPSDPKNISTQIYIQENGFLVFPNSQLENIPLNSSRQSIFVIHGYDSSGNATWVQTMADALLRTTDANVLVVDWGYGARVSYFQACANLRVVAREVVRFIKGVKIDPSLVYLIGHSLGAQCAGVIGHELGGKISRITALDPAQPMFEGFSEIVRVDSTDAIFVDAIHTDARIIFLMGFGYMAPIGNVDTYINGGSFQPGCAGSLKQQLKMLNIHSIPELVNVTIKVER